MPKHDPIKNEDYVMAHREHGEPIKYRFGQLKQDFIAHKLTDTITKLYLPRTNTYYKVLYRRTKGFKFEKIN